MMILDSMSLSQQSFQYFLFIFIYLRHYLSSCALCGQSQFCYLKYSSAMGRERDLKCVIGDLQSQAGFLTVVSLMLHDL